MSGTIDPCPFCAESRTVWKEGEHWVACFEQWQDGRKTGFWAVACTACGVQQSTVSYETPEAAIKAWNIRPTGLKDRAGRNIMKGQVVHWSDGGEELDIMERIKTRWDRIAVVAMDPDINFEVIDSPNKDVRRRGNRFHFGNFIYRDTENHLTIVAESEAEYRKKFHSAAEAMIWVKTRTQKS
jgi:hypothetical protein